MKNAIKNVRMYIPRVKKASVNSYGKAYIKESMKRLRGGRRVK